MTVSSLEAHLLALLLPQPCWDFLLVDADIWGCAAAVASVATQATARRGRKGEEERPAGQDVHEEELHEDQVLRRLRVQRADREQTASEGYEQGRREEAPLMM